VLYGVEMNAEGTITLAPRGWPRDTLQKLADVSGGRLYLNGEVDKAVAEPFEVRVAYQLTYEAPPANGKFHALRVTCSRKGVRIVAPQGYFAELPRSTANPVS